MALIDTGAEFLMSRINEDKTTGDFKELRERLADEVSSFLNIKFSLARYWSNAKERKNARLIALHFRS